jgi:hypothetical protein
MKTHNKNHSDFIVSSYPVEVTVGELKAWISRNDVASKENLVEFIHNRLNYRYIQPLLHVVPAEKKSGFLMMGSACLMIETLESFYDGKKETAWRDGGPSFKRFFEREKRFFPGFKDDAVDFYTNVRCGILHQGETKGGYRILRDDGPLLDPIERTIEANKFLKALKDCLDNYIKDLRAASISSSERWTMAIDKINFICENCKI